MRGHSTPVTERDCPILPLAAIESHNPCEEQMTLVRAEWPDGIPLCHESLERAVALGLSVMFLEVLLKQPALAEYQRVEQPALAEYQRVKQPAWAEYQRVEQAALAEYQRVKQAAWAEYQRVKQAAWAEYQRVKQAAILDALIVQFR